MLCYNITFDRAELSFPNPAFDWRKCDQ